MARYKPAHLNTDSSPGTGRRKPSPKRLARSHAPLVRLLIVAAALTAVAMLGGTAARYIRDWTGGSVVSAGSFYFHSGELNGSTYFLTPLDGEAEFKFTLQNYLVDGYYTKKDISYTYKVTDSNGNAISGASWLDGSGQPLSTGKGTLAANAKSSETLTCVIPISAFGDVGNRKLTVTAETTKPYIEKLTAVLMLRNEAVVLDVTDPGGNNGAVTVTLYNTGSAECIGTLTWPSENQTLVPDPTGESVMGSDGTLKIPSKGTVSVVFLKKSTNDYFDESNFSFTISQ